MGDKSPKSKQRSQNQKVAVKKQDTTNAKNKQAAQVRVPDLKKK